MMSTATVDRLETPRMFGERIQRGHLEELRILLLDPRVARTLWPGRSEPRDDDVIASMNSKVDHWKRFGFGLWLLRDRTTGEMVGRGGLQWTNVEDTHEVEAGWAIVPDRWGEGLATELACSALDVAFGHLGLDQVVALALPENMASRRVMEKSGFAYERDASYAGHRHVLYRARSRL